MLWNILVYILYLKKTNLDDILELLNEKYNEKFNAEKILLNRGRINIYPCKNCEIVYVNRDMKEEEEKDDEKEVVNDGDDEEDIEGFSDSD